MRWMRCVIKDFSKPLPEMLIHESRDLVQLKVWGLFGRFDYDFLITREDNPISMEPNGYGKIHLLHMIGTLARQDFSKSSC